jgi:mRNA-degrading endonuclease RelE of RelBE toxin-antitoxin system
MNSASKELKKLIENIEELIKLNVDFQNKLEKNSRPNAKKAKLSKRSKEKKKASSSSSSKKGKK